jgi:hypothetical protein
VTSGTLKKPLVWTVLLAVLLMSGVCSAAETEPAYLRVARGGNELLIRRQVPVVYTSLERFTTEIERQLPAHIAAIRRTERNVEQINEYVLCVTAEGVLVLGRQTLVLDVTARRFVLLRGAIERAYPPLEQDGPWTWLIDVPLHQGFAIGLILRAVGPWPVRLVTIDPAKS